METIALEKSNITAELKGWTNDEKISKKEKKQEAK